MTKIVNVKDAKYSELLNLFEKGEVLVLPTETVYGFVVDPKNPKAIERLKTLKKRQENKFFAVMAHNTEFISKFACVNNIYKKLCNKYIPGDLTVILKSKNDYYYQPAVHNFSNKIGIRIPNHSFLNGFLNFIKRPIIATSVNISGEVNLNNPVEINNKFGNDIGIIIDGGPPKIGVSSTIIDISENKIVPVRVGKIQIAELVNYIENA